MGRKNRQLTPIPARGPGESAKETAEAKGGRTSKPQETPTRRTIQANASNTPLHYLDGWLAVAALYAMVFAIYFPALHGQFIWDDDTHITKNEALRSLTGLRDIWFKPGATCQYYPLTFSVFWMAYHLWSLNPFGYHLLNVFMHGTAAVLLWRVLRALKIPGAWLAGALFAVHPVCVMSVAWMTELKNTLSGSLALGAAWAYLRATGLGIYERKLEGLDWRFYLLSLGLFQLALWAKTAVSFLPVTLALLAWWQGRRLNWRTLWPLLPLLGLAVGMGLTTIYVERHSGGAFGATFQIPYLERILISGRSFWFYLGKIIFPYPLTFLYGRWDVDGRAWWEWVYPLATVGLVIGLWLWKGRLGKGLLVGVLHFYVSTSLLVLLVVLYMTRYTYVSDHWQYFGCMSVLTLAAAGLTKWLERLGRNRPGLPRVLWGTLLLTLGILAWRQTGIYQNIDVLWNDTLSHHPDAWLAHNGLGEIYFHEGQKDEAAVEFEKSLTIEPDSYEAHNNLGTIYLDEGRVDEAIKQFEAACEIQPGNALFHFNLGNALVKKGRTDDGISEFQKALDIQPNNVTARNNLATRLLRKNQVQEAIVQFQKILQIDPSNAIVHGNLGNVFMQIGQVEQAIPHFQKELELEPRNLEAQNSLNRIAWLMATYPNASVRSGTKSLELAQQLVQAAGSNNPMFLGTLAAAYAETGRFSDAVTTAENAHRLAIEQKDMAQAAALQEQLSQYRANQPFRSSRAVSDPKPPTAPPSETYDAKPGAN